MLVYTRSYILLVDAQIARLFMQLFQPIHILCGNLDHALNFGEILNLCV